MASKRKYKLAIVGGGGVGRSSLTELLFEDGYDPAFEDAFLKQCVMENEVALLDFLDSTNHELFRDAEGFLLVYSVTSRNSFDEITSFYQQISRVRDKDYFPMILVGNKSDLEYERQVGTREGEDLARSFGCKFIETSTVSRVNVDNAFYEIARAIRRYNKEMVYCTADGASGAGNGGTRGSIIRVMNSMTVKLNHLFRSSAPTKNSHKVVSRKHSSHSSTLSSVAQLPLLKIPRRLDENQYDLDMMKFHFDNCLHGDNLCRRMRHTSISAVAGDTNCDALFQNPPCLRVINVRTLQVVPAPEKCDYIALSYTWDHSIGPTTRSFHACKRSFEQICKPQGLPIHRLPQTVADSIYVCQQLDEQFLWVDSICIIQDDAADKARQISVMDKIYSLAKLTIVAACNRDARQGLSCNRSGADIRQGKPVPLKQLIEESPWHTRGWTYQEYLLSRRLLIFTSVQVFYVCAEGSCAEDTLYMHPKDPENLGPGYDETHMLDTWSMLGVGSRKSRMAQYDEIIAAYTRRLLTHKSDYLLAISGILRVFARHCDDTFLCGLPSKLFPRSLLWRPVGECIRNQI